MKAQYGILRFAKYKGPEIGHIEAHNERTKEKYESNPDVDMSRSKYNLHLIKPNRKYRAEAERQIAKTGCRTRSDSVRVVEALITASPEFFKGKKRVEIKEYFSYALDFIKAHQNENTIISAVVHMDEKTPHMHLCFVPITEDGRLSVKDIVGNKKKLTWWQDEFWKHMIKKYPALERGESASKTGREHIPPRIFKEMAHLTKLRDKLEELLAVELSELQDMNFDLGLTGFSDDELAEFFGDDNDAEDDDFDVEAELEKPCFSKTGDVWHIGRHTVICGDSTLPETYNTLLGDTKVNLVCTDAPYFVDVKTASGKICY